MQRNTLLEMSGRAMHMAVRFTLNQGNDNPMMQELNFDGMNSEGRDRVERVQSFGFTSTPLPRDQKQGQQSQSGGGGGTGGDGEQAKGPAAEGIALFLGGQRNHPVVIAVDDRRHRPMGLKPGENAQYDDQGQMTLLRRGGLFLLSLDDEQGSGNGGASQLAADGSQQQNQERMVSLRHVMKKKQQRPGQSGSGSSGGDASAGTRDASGGGAQSQQDYEHEGETVNTEVRCKKNTIELLDGETVVGVYNRRDGSWTFKSKIITVTASDHLTLECTGGPTDIKGKPINFNGGGPSTPPFTVPG
jgi:phage gp45-like